MNVYIYRMRSPVVRDLEIDVSYGIARLPMYVYMYLGILRSF